jgi:hypothetical protein
MKLKTIARFLLIAFIVGVIAASLFVKQRRQAAIPADEALQVAVQKTGSTVIVYYFHGYARCVTCRTIEAYAREAVESGFPHEVKSGRVQFRAINTEEWSNEHFVRDYQLAFKSVVVVRFLDGRQFGWKNLEHVWELTGDKDKFIEYVQAETRSFTTAG